MGALENWAVELVLGLMWVVWWLPLTLISMTMGSTLSSIGALIGPPTAMTVITNLAPALLCAVRPLSLSLSLPGLAGRPCPSQPCVDPAALPFLATALCGSPAGPSPSSPLHYFLGLLQSECAELQVLESGGSFFLLVAGSDFIARACAPHTVQYGSDVYDRLLFNNQ